MDPKLQQAIAATRAGEIETAQHLLTATLQEDPQDAEAWFLLAHLVQSPDRQARYLEYALALQPDHPLAAKHLSRLLQPDVPPPVIKASARPVSSGRHPTPAPEVDSEFSPIPPARTAPLPASSSSPAPPASQTPASPVVAAQDSKRMDPDWSKTAGSPQRAQSAAPVAPSIGAPRTQPAAVPAVAAAPAQPPKQARKANKWLVALLIILVAILFFAASYLAYTFFFQ